MKKLNWTIDPLRVARLWPADQPLLMLHSGRLHSRWARWSILARPSGIYRFDGRSVWEGDPPPHGLPTFTHDPLLDLDALIHATRLDPVAAEVMALPFAGGWIGYFSYDLGRLIEPAARHERGPDDEGVWPVIELAWCPAALVYDHAAGIWYEVGETHLLNAIEDQLAFTPAIEFDATLTGALESSFAPDDYLETVGKTIDYIGAGDVFQANITQCFSAPFNGSTRDLWQAAALSSRAWYGAYLEFDAPASTPAPGNSRCVISISPELFLQVDPATRTVVTRPVKGTRPSSIAPVELRRSIKDEAELNMIIDLMRNDLGRVCEFGTVRVAAPRRIESHPTVHHGVGEVVGRLRGDVSFGDLLRGTFPGGSVTGAPKIRAMQIIDELEPVRRGPYCGALGYISAGGHVGLNIAIRTMLLSGTREDDGRTFKGVLEYGAGGGIVADSDPADEYRESLDKTEVLLQTLHRLHADAPESPARPVARVTP